MQQSQFAGDYDYHLRRMNMIQFRRCLGSLLLFVKWLTCALGATHAIHPAVYVPPNLETTIRGGYAGSYARGFPRQRKPCLKTTRKICRPCFPRILLVYLSDKWTVDCWIFWPNLRHSCPQCVEAGTIGRLAKWPVLIHPMRLVQQGSPTE